MISKEDLAKVNAFMESIQTPGLKVVCMDCGAELPGSDPTGARTSHGLCRKDFDRRMAELNQEGRAA